MKGIVYYTHNRCEERILQTCRNQLDCRGNDFPIVSVSQFPIPWGENVVVDFEPSILSMFKQILIGLETIKTDIVFQCEHDVLYHPSHFDFTPPKKDVYYFNLNVWAVDAVSGQALYYDGMKMTSGLVAYRDILLEHYEKKIKWIEEVGKFSHNLMGYEPGKKTSKGRGYDYDWDTFRSEKPNIDIKHDLNITRKRFEIKQYKSRRLLYDSWSLADGVPHWGKTKGCFTKFLKEHY